MDSNEINAANQGSIYSQTQMLIVSSGQLREASLFFICGIRSGCPAVGIELPVMPAELAIIAERNLVSVITHVRFERTFAVHAREE